MMVISKTSQSDLMEIIKTLKKSFIGLEYAIEFKNIEVPSYKCVLCKKDADQNNFIVHLNSHSHREKVLIRHFPKIKASITDIPKYKNDMEFKTKVLSKISRAIVEQFGTSKPSVCDLENFKEFEAEIIDEILRSSKLDEGKFLNIENLLKEIKNEEFLTIDSEITERKSKKKNPTKHERNERRAEIYKRELVALNFSKLSVA